mgnify:CR=1 FL=1
MFLSYLRTNWELDIEEFADSLIASLLYYHNTCSALVSDMIVKNFGENKKEDPLLKEIFLKILFVVLTKKTEVCHDDEYIIYEKSGKDIVKERILPEVLMHDTLQHVKIPDERIDLSMDYFIKKYLFK